MSSRTRQESIQVEASVTGDCVCAPGTVLCKVAGGHVGGGFRVGPGRARVIRSLVISLHSVVRRTHYRITTATGCRLAVVC